MTKWYNYFLSNKNSRLTNGHLPASKLYNTILKHTGESAYCCYFNLDYDSLKLECWNGQYDKDGEKVLIYLNQTDKVPENAYKPLITFTGYDDNIAAAALGLISFDFDSDDLEKTKNDVLNFLEWLDIPNYDYRLFFSGSKGFHIMIPTAYFGLVPSKELPYILRDLAKHLKDAYPTLDSSIYNYNRKFRVPFTLHEKTQLYKTLIDIGQLKDLTIDEIKEIAKTRKVVDFLPDDKTRKPLPQLVTAIANSKRASYEVKTEAAGTMLNPTNFERYDDKKCIKRLLESRCDDVGRNNAALRLVNDYYRTGKTRSKCEKDLYEWIKGNNLPQDELDLIITNIYDRKNNYNFGCQDDIKASYCSAKCAIWKKLDPDKRPQVADSSEADYKEEQKKKKPSEIAIIKRLLENTFKCSYDEKRKMFNNDGTIVKQGKDLFRYKDGRWQHLKDDAVDRIKVKIGEFYEAHANYKGVDAAFKFFLLHCPCVPDNLSLFAPNPNCANFKNGTLHLIESDTGKFSLKFAPHNPADYITYQIPFDYPDNIDLKNDEFEDLLERIFAYDEDKEFKKNALSEMFGASLMPYFPHLFYLYGESNSGKSTLMIILRMLLGDEENICNVQPKHFSGFDMEGMAGKLVNMVTDVDTRTVIADDVVKQIEDRIPVRIRRKNRADLNAPLPAVHIFGGNSLLKSFEGYSKAFARRWTIIKFNTAHTGPKQRNYASVVFKHNPEAILCFALKGLYRLVESQGYFSTFDSNEKELKDWARNSDLLEQFFNDALMGDFDRDYVVDPEARIERKVLWELFKNWQEDCLYKYDTMSKNQFFAALAEKKITTKVVQGVRYFQGFGEIPKKLPENDKI